MKIRVSPLLLLVLLALALASALGSAAPAAEPTASPGSLDPATHEAVLEEMLAALRSGSRASMQAFLDSRFGGDDAMDTMEFMSAELGRDLGFHGIIERSDDRIVGLVSAGERWVGVVLEFRDEAGGLTAIGLRRAEAPSDSKLASATRSELVRETAVWLRRGYVLPELGPRMADALLGLMEAGAYDELSSPDALAIRLTDDLRDIYPDLHLTVLSPAALQRRERMLAGHSGSGRGAATPEPAQRHRWYEHGGITELWWKESGNSAAAVVRFSALAEGPETFETLRRALQEMSQRDALVIDLRGVPGHDASVVQEVISHFIQQRERMGRIETVDPRTGERTVRSQWVEPGALSARLRGKPVYVLVDSRTASAAEALAGLLQRLGGATLVGERTAGAGHMTTTVPLAAGFGLQLPTGRGLGEDGFEGRGLQPDIAVSPEDALEVALARLGIAG